MTLIERLRGYDYRVVPEAADELDRLTARVKALEEGLREIEAECTCAIAYEPLPRDFPKYKTHDEVPNGLRTVAHIKLSMIRETARSLIGD